MRRLWMGVVAVLVLAACRSEGTSDRTPGAQQRSDRNINAEQGRAPRQEGQAEGRKEIGVARIITMIQAFDQGEIEMSRLAAEHASSADVKAYAAKLAADHQQDLEASTRLTQSKRIDMGAAQDDPFIKARREACRDKLQQLAKLDGRAFDEAYMEGQASEHAMLAAIARQGEELSRENDVDAYLRMVSEQAQDHRGRAATVQSKLCALPQQAQAEIGAQAAPAPASRPQVGAQVGAQTGTQTGTQAGTQAGGSQQGTAAPRGVPPANRRQ